MNANGRESQFDATDLISGENSIGVISHYLFNRLNQLNVFLQQFIDQPVDSDAFSS